MYIAETRLRSACKFHRNYQFAILDPDWNIIIISFVRGRYDTVAPVIPAGRFARMTQVRLVTSKARGSLYGPPVPTVSPPQPIFAKTGWHLAMIGSDFASDDDGPFGACWFNYVNHRRLKPGSAAPQRRIALTPQHQP
jgi:hypothetical protein